MYIYLFIKSFKFNNIINIENGKKKKIINFECLYHTLKKAVFKLNCLKGSPFDLTCKMTRYNGKFNLSKIAT